MRLCRRARAGRCTVVPYLCGRQMHRVRRARGRGDPRDRRSQQHHFISAAAPACRRRACPFCRKDGAAQRGIARCRGGRFRRRRAACVPPARRCAGFFEPYKRERTGACQTRSFFSKGTGEGRPERKRKKRERGGAPLGRAKSDGPRGWRGPWGSVDWPDYRISSRRVVGSDSCFLGRRSLSTPSVYSAVIWSVCTPVTSKLRL